MSKTTMFKIHENGTVSEFAEFSNSHRYAMMVWMRLADVHTPNMTPFDDRWWGEVDARLRKAYPDDAMVLEITFDNWAIRGGARLRQAARAFRAFDHQHWPPGSQRHGVSHLPAMAEAFDRLADEGAYGACIWTTSTTSNPWDGYNFMIDRDHKWVGEDAAVFSDVSMAANLGR